MMVRVWPTIVICAGLLIASCSQLTGLSDLEVVNCLTNCAGGGAGGFAGRTLGDAGTSSGVAGARSPSCSPATCQELGKNCGQVDDGCGHILLCGLCQKPLTCGSQGTQTNVCSCPPNSFLCDGSSLLQCSANGAYYALVAQCASPAACNVPQGQCAPCSVGSNACFDQQLRTCVDTNASQPAMPVPAYAPASVAPCPNGTACNPRGTNGSCDACVAGATFCVGSQLQRCDNMTPSRSSPLETCATPVLCMKSVYAGSCVRPSCKIAETRCNNGNVETCNQDRTAFELTSRCGAVDSCRNGACVSTSPLCIGFFDIFSSSPWRKSSKG